MPELVITGLGPAGLSLLPDGVCRTLTGATSLLLRTGRHPAAADLAAAGVPYDTLDGVYEGAPDFEALYPMLAEAVRTRARRGDLVYAVPGNPLMGEESVRLLLAHPGDGVTVRVLGAPGFVDATAVALASRGIVPELAEWQVVDAHALEEAWWDPGRAAILYQVDDTAVASRAKLALLDVYPEEWPVHVVRRAGDPRAEEVITLPLFQLDRPEAGAYDHLSSVYVPPLPADRRRPGFRELVGVVARLRAPDGCPWDREQDYLSLRRFVLEEACEVIDAVEEGDADRLSDELGDLLLQVLLYAQIARERGDFDLADVIAGHHAKLVRRHPHVFGDVKVGGTDDVLRNWEAIKQAERGRPRGLLEGVPVSLPALLGALEVNKRAAKVGFDWPGVPGILDKLEEELGELRREIEAGAPERVHCELGDVLFVLVNLARRTQVDPEEALRAATRRFCARFGEMERQAAEEGRRLDGRDLDDLERLWQEAKRREETPAGRERDE